jgi:DNA-directed RNA polymerase specialized sigma24 family protein
MLFAFRPESRSPSTGFPKGLGPKKTDLSHYTDRLTEKQRQAFSLKYEYELGLAEIASRMGLDRKTAYEHIEAAKRKIDQARSSEKRKAHRLTREDE